MKKNEVKIGETYVMKVSGKLTHVRLDALCSYGGWTGTNMNTHHEVRIRSAAKLRSVWTPPQPGDAQYEALKRKLERLEQGRTGPREPLAREL